MASLGNHLLSLLPVKTPPIPVTITVLVKSVSKISCPEEQVELSPSIAGKEWNIIGTNSFDCEETNSSPGGRI